MCARPLLLGHRGARATRSILENTIASFERALADGCDGFELDLRLTADDSAVVCHDPEVGQRAVAEVQLAELTELARFEEVLQKFSARAFLDVELKVAGLEQTVLDAIRSSEPQRGFVVSSFHTNILTTLRNMDDALPLGLICDRESECQSWKELPVDVVIPHHRLLSASMVEEVHGAGKRVFVWTVNDREAMRRFAEWGVDALISDDTELLSRTFGKSR